MVIVACLEAIALVAIVHLLLRHFRDEAADWATERRELLTRIQRPDLVPLSSVTYSQPESEPDEIGLVGTIQERPEGD